MSTGRSDLDGILQTIREVEESLDRRAQRGVGAVMIVWGVMGGLIFGFYHLVERDEAGYEALLGDTLIPWAWVAPVLVGYALTAVLGARLGRVRSPEGATAMWRLLVALVPPIAVCVVLVALDMGEPVVRAMWVGFLGYTFLVWGRPTPGHPSRLPVVAGVASLVVAAVLLVPALHAWASLVAAVWYVVVLGGMGALTYARGA